MVKAEKPVVRLSDLELKQTAKGRDYASASARIGSALGLTRLGAGYAEVPPGKTFCPFHVHHEIDEMFVVLAGEGEYRFGDQRFKVAAGDVLGAPVGGQELAHQLWNIGTEPLKYLMISSKSDVDICEYPDTGKFAASSTRGVRGGQRQFNHIGRSEQNLDYFDGDVSAKGTGEL
ncbi:MAG: cupin domain-containing protein [Devosia sp.]